MSHAPTPEDHNVQPDAQQAEQAPEAPVEGELLDNNDDRVAELENLVKERTADLQRLQAEYVNYKRRVDRDRAQARQSGVESVAGDLLSVMDSIALAEGHGELTGGFKLVSDELDKIAKKHGLVQFGAVGDEFDPVRHEALMEQPLDQPVDVTTISNVLQNGYELGGRVIRPARVAVAQPGA